MADLMTIYYNANDARKDRIDHVASVIADLAVKFPDMVLTDVHIALQCDVVRNVLASRGHHGSTGSVKPQIGDNVLIRLADGQEIDGLLVTAVRGAASLVRVLRKGRTLRGTFVKAL